jgi:hypothetical protein
MQIIIWNRLDHDVHLTVVMYSSLALEFIITPYRVPVATGKVLHRDTIEPEMAANMVGVSEDILPRIVKQYFDRPFRVYLVDERKIPDGKKTKKSKQKKEPDVVFILRRENDYDDEDGVEKLEEG